MITEEKFNDFVKSHGITTSHSFLHELARQTWDAAEKACFNEYDKTPMLCKDYENTKASLTDLNSLSKEEYQFLTWVLSQVLRQVDTLRLAIKPEIDGLWDMCNPENYNSYPYYKKLNQLRDASRNLKNKSNKLSEIQRKLKAAR